MIRFGYKLMSEEHAPAALFREPRTERLGVRARESGGGVVGKRVGLQSRCQRPLRRLGPAPRIGEGERSPGTHCRSDIEILRQILVGHRCIPQQKNRRRAKTGYLV